MTVRRSLFLAFALVLGVASQSAQAACGQTYTLATAQASANWTDTTIWSPSGSFPGAAANDCATLGAGSGPITLTVNSVIPNAIDTLDSNCAGCVIEIVAGGQLSLSDTGVVDNSGQIVLNGGTFNVTGSEPGGLTFKSGTNLHLMDGTLNGAGTGAVILDLGATLDFDTAASPTLDGIRIENVGNINLSPSSPTNLNLSNSSTINNSGTITINNHLNAINGSAADFINNGGLVQMNGSNTTTVHTTFDNLGGGSGVEINGGILSLASGGTGDAPFVINGNSALEFPTGCNYTMTANGTVSGSGTLAVSGGTLSIGGVTAPANFSLTAGTLTGPGFLTVSNDFVWSGGTITSATGAGGTQVDGTGHASFDGTTGPMSLENRTLDLYGTSDYTALANDLSLSNGATLAVYGSFAIQNDGTIGCTTCGTTLLKVSPNGFFYKGAGAGNFLLALPTQNDASVAVFSGSLEFAGNGTHNGSFYTSSGSTLKFSAPSTTIVGNIDLDGNIEFSSGSTDVDGSFTVDGKTTISGGTATFSNPATTNDFALDTGVLDVDDFHMTGIGTWSCGTIQGTAFTVDTGATLTVDSVNSTVHLDDATLTNDGTINYTATVASGNSWEVDDGMINNNGMFDLQTDAPISVGGVIILRPDQTGVTTQSTCAHNRSTRAKTVANGALAANSFNNFGTLQKSGGTGATDLELDLYNQGSIKALSGTLRAVNEFDQSDGSTMLGPGGIETSLLDITGGVLNGEGTVTGNVTNDGGDIAPGTPATTGIINITGNFTQTTLAVESLKIKLEGPAAGQFDQLNITGTANLDGTLTATLLNGYEPANGATFPVMTYASHSGSFATENLPTYQVPHGSITSSYNPTSYQLIAVVTPSSADLTLGLTCPANVNAVAFFNCAVAVTNQGPDSVTGTTVVHTLPPTATGGSGSGTGWLCGAPSGGTITCTSSTPLASLASLPTLTIAMNAPANAGSIANSATVSSATTDPNLTNNTSSQNTNVIAQANLAITKSGPGGVTAGQNVVYMIVVTNNGPSSATGVTVTDPLPANLTFVSNSGACTGAFPCNLGTLTSGQSVTITSTYSTSPTFSGNVTNIATVSATTADPDNSVNSATAVTNVGAQADLSVTKTGPATVVPGQNVTYTIMIGNAGPSPATNVIVSDPTPIGVAFQSNSGACASAYPCNVGTLNAGQSVSITSTYTVPGNYSSASVVNTASVTSDVNDPNLTDNGSTATTTVTPQADLGITKNGPSSVAPGALITYTINVTNFGPSSAASVVVTDPDPSGLTFVSNTGACTTPFPCSLGTLASAATAQINATFSVPSNYASSSITNTASVSFAATDPTSGNNSSTVVTPVVAQSDVSILKTGPAFFDTNQDLTYTIAVTNNGPLVATNTFVDDPTPPGLTFVSNSGACAGPFPCGLGSLSVGQTLVITSTFHVPGTFPDASITNTATVSTSTIDLSPANNSSTTITPRSSGEIADLSILKSGPGVATTGTVDFIIAVTNNGPTAATAVVITDPTPSGLSFLSADAPCTTGFPCMIGSLGALQTAVVHVRYAVLAAPGTTVTNTASVASAATDPQSANNSSSAPVQIQAAPVCPTSAPQIIGPVDGVVVGSPVAFTWSAVPDATEYVVTIGGPTPKTLIVTNTSATATLSPGAYTWTVGATGTDCPAQTSDPETFVVCGGTLPPPVASAVAETTTGQTYAVQWTAIEGAVTYELQQDVEPTFGAPTTFELSDLTMSFTKTTTIATGFFYRVRARSSCGVLSPFSATLRVVVVPVPEPNTPNVNINVPSGSTTPVTFQVFVPGIPGGSTTFIATVDKPWLSVSPTSGIVPADGTLLTVSADPSLLPNGTWTGTILVVYGSVTVAHRVAVNGGAPPPYSFPVSISLVTPITPAALTGPAASALVIPAVGHLAGLNSTWRSDIRLANTSALLQKYKLTFNSGSGNSASLLSTSTISVDAGSTTALDDVVRKWFGTGSLGESSNGALVIEPLDKDGKVSSVPSTTTSVSSRTFNASATGTLGQFIPAVPIANFITKIGGAANSLLSLQQLAQTSDYRTNLGILESSGRPASVLVNVFNEIGAKLLEIPLALRGGEQQQLNGFLADRGIVLPNGRVEVSVVGGDGKVTAYASVVDSHTTDPFLVFGVPVGGHGASRFVVPGVADLAGGTARWRTDVRLFNSSTQPQITTLTFYPTGDPSHSIEKQTTVAPGEVKALDAVLSSVFGVTNTGGALHVSTPVDTPLIVTARTYDQQPGGTVGQFVPAVAQTDAVGFHGRSLQILQAEESPRYRTNLGIAEVSGKPAVIEVAVHLPDSKITPVIQVSLAANEFRQLPILSGLNLGALYNTRISVSVIEGEGSVTAYGSVLDRRTGDPTYIPAQ